TIPMAILLVLNLMNIFPKYLHLFCGIAVWYFFLQSGIHPTIAGVLLAFTVPLRQKTDVKTFTLKLCEISDEFKQSATVHAPLLTSDQIEQIDEIEEWVENVQSPLQHIEHVLQSWVAYLVMPLFAFFNAGVTFTAGMQPDMPLITNLTISLFLGKTVGITLFSYIGIRLKFAGLPYNVSFGQIIGIAMLAGVGFTMSMFIANLAFADAYISMDSARIGILAGSLVSGAAGYLMLRFCRQGNDHISDR
ncbi:MAG: Na+/H+ antiporter NhaA, partial [Bacteroidales bacterium]